jgi:glycosyltransferase involved in cell wall biosynthesis
VQLIIFIRNKVNPSDYYRIYQYVDRLKESYNLKIISSFPSFYYNYLARFSKNKILSFTLKIVSYPLIQLKLSITLIELLFRQRSTLFIQREIFPRKVGVIRKALLNKLISKNKVIWDFDDNIIEMNEISQYEFDLLETKSSVIFVCNDFLMSLIDKEFQNKVMLLPTSDIACSQFYIDKSNSIRLKDYNKIIKLSWVGTFNNLKFLEDVVAELDESAEILKKKFDKELQLKIISDAALETKCNHLKIINIKWGRERVIEELFNTHIGLLPLDNNNLTKGKCAFKAVQYIGFGIPVIASNVGFNKEVIKNGENGYLIDDKKEWVTKVISLSTNTELWGKFSINSRSRWLKDFSAEDIISQIKIKLGQSN